MNHFQKAAEDIKFLANKFSSILEVANELEKIGSLEQAAQEAKLHREAAIKELEPIQKVLSEKKAELSAAEDAIKNALANAKGIEISARQKHDQILKEGREAVRILHDEVVQKRAELGGELINHHAHLNAIKGEVDSKKSELKLIQEHIADAKAKISSIIK